MRNTLAARAALLAYTAACRSGAGTDVAVAVALARYRSFFPLAAEFALRGALAHALAVERLRARGLIGRGGGTATPRPDRQPARPMYAHHMAMR